MREKQEFKITEKQYAIGKLHGIPRDTVYRRVYMGWDIKRAITEPVNKPSGERKRYLELAKKNGISSDRFWSRTNNGWSYKDAATIPILNKREHMERLRSSRRSLLSKEQWEKAAQNNIAMPTVYRRIRVGWDIERAITEPTDTRFRRKNG